MNRILRLFRPFRLFPATFLSVICGGAMLFAQDVAPPPATPTPTPAPVTPETAETLAVEPALDVSTKADRPPRRSRRSNRSARELVVVGSDARVKEGEEFSDVVVVGGNAAVDGTVRGDLVTVLGKVRLGPKAVVNGDLVVVAGALDADPGAIIKGSPVIVGGIFSGLIDTFHHHHHPWWVRVPGEWFHHGLAQSRMLPHQFAWSWAFAGVALLGCLLVTLVFPRAVASSVGTLRASPGRSFAAGVLGLVVLPPLTILLVMTGVGLLVVPLVIAGTVIAFVFGNVAVFGSTGQRLGSLFGAGMLQKPWLAVIVGAVLFSLLYAVPYLGLLAWTAALIFGFGAVLLALFKREPRPAMAMPGVTAAAIPGSAMAISETESSAATMARAGFWRRLMATLLDAVLIGLVVGPLLHAPKWFLLIWVAYHVALWSWKGTTIGGIVLGLRIVRVDGRPINFAVALVRSLASFFSAAVLGLGFLWAGWTRDKQSWHDKIAGTVIVKPPKGTTLV